MNGPLVILDHVKFPKFAEIVELTLRTTLCGFFNSFCDAMGIEMEEGVLEDLLVSGSAPEPVAAAG